MLNNKEDTLDIYRLIEILVKYKIFICSLTIFSGLLCLIFSFTIAPIYTSTALLEPNPKINTGVRASQIDGAASLIGVNLGSASSSVIVMTI